MAVEDLSRSSAPGASANSRGGLDLDRPRWRTSSPRLLNAAFGLIVIGVIALGTWQNLILERARADAEYEWSVSRDVAAARLLTPELAAAEARTRAIATALADIEALIKAKKCREALARATTEQATYPDNQPLAAALARAANCLESEERAAALDTVETERRQRALAAALRLLESGDHEAALASLDRARNEVRAREEIDIRRAEILLEMADERVAALEFTQARALYRRASATVEDLRGAKARQELARRASEGAVHTVAVEAEAALASGAAAGGRRVRELATELVGLGRWHDAVRLLAKLGASGDEPALAEARALYSAEIGRDLVLVPGGEITLRELGGATGERVEVADFKIARREMTRGEFLLAVALFDDPASIVWPGASVSDSELPITGVTRAEAARIAALIGCRLPTESEWQRAAAGLDDRAYPWGQAPLDDRLANVAPPLSAGLRAGEGRAQLAAVGARPAGASPFGCLDLAGNAAEWTASDVAIASADGAGANEQLAIVRGGSFALGARAATTTHRMAVRADRADPAIGLRLAADAPR